MQNAKLLLKNIFNIINNKGAAGNLSLDSLLDMVGILENNFQNLGDSQIEIIGEQYSRSSIRLDMVLISKL